MKNIKNIQFVIGLILAGILTRLIPHAPNFTAVGATALFAGAMMKPKWMSFILPLIILWLSDLFLNNGMYKNMYPDSYTGWVWIGSIWVYTGFILITFIGAYVIKKIGFKSIVFASILSSLVFFLLTNFGVWYKSTVWAQNISGLTECYLFALPFLWNTLAADILFSAMIFGIYSYVYERKLAVAR